MLVGKNMEISTTVLHEDIILVELNEQFLEEQILKNCLQKLSQQGFHKIVCSLEGVDQIQTTVLSVLLNTLSSLRQKGGDILFVEVCDTLKHIFHCVGCKEEGIFLSDANSALNEFLTREQNSYAVTIKNPRVDANAETSLVSKEQVKPNHQEDIDNATIKVESTQRLDQERYIVTQKRSPANILNIQPKDNEIEIPLLGYSQKISDIHKQILHISQEKSPTLLLGKVNCGEDAIAHCIHKNSQAKGTFTFVDCAAIEKQDKVDEIMPKILLAVEGSVFFKNIDQLSTEEQNKLYETLMQFSSEIKAMCHCSKDAVAKLSFNINSFFSKNIIQVPTLLERKEDILVLAEAYLSYHSKQHKKNIACISDKSQKFLLQHNWSDDLAELKKMIVEHIENTSENDKELNLTGQQPNTHRTLNNYQLLDKIGEGGMGEVWKGKHDTLERPVVVKLIREDTHEEDLEVGLKRFQREAQTIAELQSPHTISLYDFGIHQENTVYYVMEMLHGVDLDELVLKFGPIPPERTIYLLSQMCLSLMEAHAFGIIHRDIKPQNIFLCKLGAQFDFIKILDFGIVKRQGDVSNLTGDNIVGSPYFMAPELAISEEIDVKVDVYSFGCTAYWLLCGRYIFYGKTILSLITQHVNEDPKPLIEASKFDIPKELNDVVMDCLHKKPEKRPTIKEVRKRLENIQLNTSWSLENSQEWWEKHLPQFVTFK